MLMLSFILLMEHSKSVVHCPLFLCRVANGTSDPKDLPFSVSQSFQYIKYLRSSGLGKVRMKSISEERDFSAQQLDNPTMERNTKVILTERQNNYPQYMFFALRKKSEQTKKSGLQILVGSEPTDRTMTKSERVFSKAF